MNPTQNYLCPQHGGSFTAKCDICGGTCDPITEPPKGAQAETPLESALAWADEIVQLESVALGRAKRNIQALASAARDDCPVRKVCPNDDKHYSK